MKFLVEIQDYEPGGETETVLSDQVEDAIRSLLDQDGSGGTVIVQSV